MTLYISYKYGGNGALFKRSNIIELLDYPVKSSIKQTPWFMIKNLVKRNNNKAESSDDLSTIERDTRSIILDFLQQKYEENELSKMDQFGLTKMRM